MLSVARTLQGSGFVRVVYRDYMSLRVPLSATTLAPNRPQVQAAKLCPGAIKELLSRVEECEVDHVSTAFQNLGEPTSHSPNPNYNRTDPDFSGGNL